MSITSFLFRAARLSADLSAIASGDPKRIARRAKNKAVGRLAARGGLFRVMYGGGRRRKKKEQENA